MTGTGVIKAFDLAGKELWMRDLPNDYSTFGMQVSGSSTIRARYVRLSSGGGSQEGECDA